MRLIYPRVDVVAPNYEDALSICCRASSLCYNKKFDPDMPLLDKARLIGRRIKAGHESILEHASMTVQFTCDRGITHELVRHRLCSFTQSSTRYIDLCSEMHEGLCVFVIPPNCHTTVPGVYHKPTDQLRYEKFDNPEQAWFRSMLIAEAEYQLMRNEGWSPEWARSVLPNSTAAIIQVTANMREWRHILALRAEGTTGRPHPQMRQIMLPLWAACYLHIPAFFPPYEPTDLYRECGCDKVQTTWNGVRQ